MHILLTADVYLRVFSRIMNPGWKNVVMATSGGGGMGVGGWVGVWGEASLLPPYLH